jgi:hypothetical protein
MPMLSVPFHIAYILHNLLGVVPQIFLHTVQENCDEEQLKEVGQWCYEKLPQIMSDNIYLQNREGYQEGERFCGELAWNDLPTAS